ncbi:MAG: DUF1499 domain-containing protein [Rhodocyclales bacterium]|nr:DUF1499 domain-containing protein [Rhodocyclales bacterium]
MRTVLRRAILTIVALLTGIVAGGQMGLFAGKRPADLGVHEGRLKPAPTTPNCVNSQSADGYSRIAPLTYAGDGKSAMARIHAIVEAMPAGKLIDFRGDYIYAEFTSKLLGFVDDVEFFLDEKAGVIHVRSASRLGHGDHGVNRQRVEAVRQALGS